MLLLPLVPALLMMQSPAKDDKPVVPAADRSGEATLRQIMESASKLKSANINIGVSSRSTGREVFQPEETIAIWYQAPDRFSVVTSGVWGDSARFVSDGKTYLYDAFDDYQSVILRDGSPTLLETEAELSRRVDPLMLLFRGPQAIEKIVAKDGFIKDVDPAGPEKAVQYKSLKKGTVTLYYDQSDARKLVTRVEYDNRPYLEEQHKLYPEWWDAPDEPLTVLMITYASIGKSPPRGVLSTTPPKNKSVMDNRTKPAKKPPLVSFGLAGL